MRVFVPPPHGSEQVEKALQSPTTQSTGFGVGSGVGRGVGAAVGAGVGHASTSHAFSSCRIAGHASPPSLCNWVISRERAVTPGPHVALHAVQSVQAASSQSTGQGAVAQSAVSVVLGHSAPPCSGSVTVRIRDRVPPPQVAEHSE
jgi:hypothetical protein